MSRKNKIIDTGFSICIGDALFQTYWRDGSPYLLLKLSDVEAANLMECAPEKGFMHSPNYIWIHGVLFVAGVDHIDIINKIDRVAWSAWKRAGKWDIAEQLASESECFAEGLKLNNQGIGNPERDHILSVKYPDYDPRRDDIWSAAHRRLMEQRRKYGAAPEYKAIEDALYSHGLIVRNAA